MVQSTSQSIYLIDKYYATVLTLSSLFEELSHSSGTYTYKDFLKLRGSNFYELALGLIS